MIKIQVKKKLLTSRGPLSLEVDFSIQPEEFAALFGPSGAGKTTILRMIAGLTRPDEGLISVDGETWFDSARGTNKSVQERAIGFVFQDYNLFGHMSVRENLLYALKDKKDVELLEELMALTELNGLDGRRPGNLSGGQKQRVALVRALLRKPKVFLLDEPLSALDMGLRLKLQDDLCVLHRRFKIPTLFVTHDTSEIFKVAQRIFVLHEGRVVRSGRPDEVFAAQALSGKFQFAGNILELRQDGFLIIVTVQIGNNLTKVVATEEEARTWRPGDRVIVAAKAFNPIIMKIENEPSGGGKKFPDVGHS